MKAVKQTGGEDAQEAEYMADLVVSMLNEKGIDKTNVEDIQDLVEKVLIERGHAATAKEYILFRANRDRVRNMNSAMMKTFESLTFGSTNDVELKRENANIDGNTAMGTMLRYGSEGAKSFNLNYLISPRIARAHKNGDIHIHDLDFMALTETCLTADSKIVIRQGKDIKEVSVCYLDEYLNDYDDDAVIDMKAEKLYVYDNGKFTMIKNCVRHIANDKRVLRIHSTAATIEVTDNHLIPVIIDGDISLLHASEIESIVYNGKDVWFIKAPYIGDTIKYADNAEDMYKIDSVNEIVYEGYVYDLETTSHYFMTNGVRVHNCCQIDLEKLFSGGFNTGHGTLREPSEIRSYAALACIAIQANQNEMHKSVAYME